METKEIVRNITTGLSTRKECLDVAVDRGRGKGMQIEKWALVEMLPKLIRLKQSGIMDETEGEHEYTNPKYPNKKDKEHCDFWWKINNEEHWLEVKTIVLAQDGLKGSMKEISKDIKKQPRLKEGIFHHLTIIFPLEKSDIEDWKQQVISTCKKKKLLYDDSWSNNIDNKNTILFVLCTNLKV